MRFASVPLAAAVAALALAACGESSEDKAQNTVCDARDEISAEVQTLRALTPQTISVDAVQSSVSAISDDLKRIVDAEGELSDERRSEVQAATTAFSGEVRDVAQSLVAGGSASSAKTQLAGAVDELTSSFQRTFAQIDCA